MQGRPVARRIGLVMIGVVIGLALRPPQPRAQSRIDFSSKIYLHCFKNNRIIFGKILTPYSAHLDSSTPSGVVPPSDEIWYIELANGRVRILATESPASEGD